MRIIVLGGGAVGALVARRLIREKNEVVVVESNPERCVRLESILNAKIIHGQANSIQTLEKAGLSDAEMLIAVTNSDEANLLACLIAQANSNIRIKVVRMRTHEVDQWESICESELLNIDLVIHPDRETAERILKVVNYPGVSEVLEFSEGKVQLIGMNIEESSWVVGKSMAELDESSPPKNSLMAMLLRGNKLIIPRGNDRLQPGDHVHIVIPFGALPELLTFMGIKEVQSLKRVFIVGGKQIGIEVALQLERRGVQVKLFERERARCEKISTLVNDTIVIHGDGTDQRTLIEENIEGIDAYFALTGDDEDNIIASLF